MERKSPLLLVVTIALFGIAVAGAVWIFGQRNVQVRRDTIISGIQHIAADAVRFRFRLSTMGGGGGSYAGYSIPAGLRESQVAVYEVSRESSPDTLIILATGAQKIGTITGLIDTTGALTIFKLTGELEY